jgi:hypothetical protein
MVVRPHHFDVGVCVIPTFFLEIFGANFFFSRIKRREAINEPGHVAEDP